MGACEKREEIEKFQFISFLKITNSENLQQRFPVFISTSSCSSQQE